MKETYFQPKPSEKKAGKFQGFSSTFRFGADPVRYKSFKKLPLRLKLLVGGTVALGIFLLLLPLVNMKNKELDEKIALKTERVHEQIVQGKFREVFLEGDRQLIVSYDENAFEARLADSQKYLTGKYEKTGGSSAHYLTVMDKLKSLIGKPYSVGSYYSFNNNAGRGDESFYWVVRGDEIKLADYELTVRSY